MAFRNANDERIIQHLAATTQGAPGLCRNAMRLMENRQVPTRMVGIKLDLIYMRYQAQIEQTLQMRCLEVGCTDRAYQSSFE